MAVKIGSARIDERGKTTGGTAGDQRGNEVSTQNWYLHKKGWILLRAKDPKVRAAIAVAMQAACNNNKIGYDQNQRLSLLTQVKSRAYDPARATAACETDCSALVRVCILYALNAVGMDVTKYDPGNFRTATQVKMIMATGLFDKFTDDDHCRSSKKLAIGDILVTKTSGHTVVVLGNGTNCDADIKKVNTGAKHVVVTGNAVNIRTSPTVTQGASRVIGIGHKNDELVYQDKTENGFYLVEYKNQNAWISMKYSKLEG